MLNDATCFQNVYIVCGYTDLRSGIDKLASIIEQQAGKSPFVPDTLICSAAGKLTGSKDWSGRRTGSCSCTRDWNRESSNGPGQLPRYRL